MTATIVIVVLVGLIWGAVLLRRGGLIAGCLVVLAAGCCLGYPWFHIETPWAPLTVDRVLLALLAAACVAYRKLGWTSPKPCGAAELFLLLFLAVLAASTFTHDWRVHGRRPAATLVFFYGAPTLLYFIARQATWRRAAVLASLAAIALFGIYLAVTAIAEVRQAWWLVFPRYIASADYWEFFGRGRGPLLNPVGNGLFLAAACCAVVSLWPWLDRPLRLAALGASLLLGAGVLCTLTRSVWLGAASALLVVIGLNLSRRWRIALVGGAVLASTLLLAAKWNSFLEFKRDKYVSAHDVRESARLRPILAAVAWRMFLDRPLWGCGFGQYPAQSVYYLSDRTSSLPLEKARPYVQHNVLLALLTETGLAGMGLYIALLGGWGRTAWRLWRNRRAPLWARQYGLFFLGWLAALLANGMFQDVSIIRMVNMLLFFLAAGVSALASQMDAAADEKAAATQVFGAPSRPAPAMG